MPAFLQQASNQFGQRNIEIFLGYRCQLFKLGFCQIDGNFFGQSITLSFFGPAYWRFWFLLFLCFLFHQFWLGLLQNVFFGSFFISLRSNFPMAILLLTFL